MIFLSVSAWRNWKPSMKTDFFRRKVLEDVKKRLASGRAEIKQLKAAAREIMETMRGKENVSNEEVIAFARKYPELAASVMVQIAKESEAASEESVSQIRARIRRGTS